MRENLPSTDLLSQIISIDQLKQGARRFFLISYMGYRGPTNLKTLSSAAFPRSSSGIWIGSQAAGSKQFPYGMPASQAAALPTTQHQPERGIFFKEPVMFAVYKNKI